MFIGNERKINFLQRTIERGSVSHAYLLLGPESVGKFLAARKFAEKLIEGRNGHSRLFENESMPVRSLSDLLVLEPEVEEKRGVVKKKEIGIEKIRNAQKDLALFPQEGKYRILIINDAHKMSKSSQNALLKTIEEPNETSIVILVAHDEKRILSTVKSRCQKLFFNSVALEEIKNSISGKRADALALFSMGRPGLAVRMAEDEEFFGATEKVFSDLKNIFAADINERMALADRYAKNIPEATGNLKFWIWVLRIQAYKNMGNRPKMRSLYGAIEKIEKILDVMNSTNANSRLLLENLMINL